MTFDFDPALAFPVGSIVGIEVRMPERFITLPLDGSRVWRVDWPELFAVLGTGYGGGNTPAHFNLPNFVLRTIFNDHVEVGPGAKIVARILPKPPVNVVDPAHCRDTDGDGDCPSCASGVFLCPKKVNP